MPPYHGVHDVIPTSWTYSDADKQSPTINGTNGTSTDNTEDKTDAVENAEGSGDKVVSTKEEPGTKKSGTKTIDLSIGPPPYRAKNYAHTNGKLKVSDDDVDES